MSFLTSLWQSPGADLKCTQDIASKLYEEQILVSVIIMEMWKNDAEVSEVESRPGMATFA